MLNCNIRAGNNVNINTYEATLRDHRRKHKLNNHSKFSLCATRKSVGFNSFDYAEYRALVINVRKLRYAHFGARAACESDA